MLPSIVIAVVIATAFFIHEAFPTASKEYLKAKANWETAKVESSKALNMLKQLNFDLRQEKITPEEFLAKQPVLVDDYTQKSKKKNDLYKIVLEYRSKEKFLHFRTFQYFLGELGWAAGLFLYAFVSLLNTLYLKARYVKREFTGQILLHSTLLFVGCFYTFYVLYSKKDFDKIWYMLAMVLCTVVLVIASKFITDSYIKRTEYLRKNIQRLMSFIFRIRTSHYSKVAVKALYAERQNVVIDEFDDSVEDNSNEFDKDFYQTLRKIEL